MVDETNIHVASMQEQLDFWKGKCLSIKGQMDEEIAIRQSQSTNNVPTLSIDPILLLKKELNAVTQGLTAVEQLCHSHFLSLSEDKEIDRQYSRKNSILLHGYKDLPKVNKHQFVLQTVDELNFLFPGFGIHPFHIDDAHPLPSKRNHSNKLVVVKFKNRWLKRLIVERFEGRRLRRPGISVSQHLTDYTRQLEKLAVQVVGPQNVSVEDTIIHAHCSGRSFTIKYGSDISTLKQAKCNETNHHSSPHAPVASRGSPATGANLTPIGSDVNVAELPINNNTVIYSPPPSVSNLYSTEFPNLYGLLTERSSFSAKPPVPRGFPSRHGRGGFTRISTHGVPLNHLNSK